MVHGLLPEGCNSTGIEARLIVFEEGVSERLSLTKTAASL
jgi:hypothetical protein